MVISLIGNTIGLPEDQVRFLLCILLSFPLGYINFFIYNPTLRILYGLIPGMILQYFMYGKEMIHLVVITTITYIFISLFGRKISSFYILIYSILHLSSVQIVNMINNYGGWEIDVTTILMMSICKFSSIAFSYEDGGKDDSLIKNSYHRSKYLLYNIRKIVNKPTILEVFSYIFFYPSSIVGPSFEFSDFLDFIYMRGDYVNIPKELAVKSALTEYGKGLICIAIYQIGKLFYDLNYIISEDFSRQNFLLKFLIFNYVMSLLRAKYYVCWKFGQATITFCGMSYTTQKEKVNEKEVIVHKFDKINTVGIYEVETHANPKIKIQYWNRTVHLWLKYNVFLRVININHPMFKDKIGMASLVTFLVSAFWHGFYPAYYICFFHSFFVEQACDLLEKKFGLFEKAGKLRFPLNVFYQYLKIKNRFCIMTIPNYLGIVFSLLQVSQTLTFMKSMYFIPNLCFILPYFIIPLLGGGRSKKKESIKKDNASESNTEQIKQE